MRTLLVFPGGGSPQAPGCKSLFSFLEEEGARRGWHVETLTYLGGGHAPDVGAGLDLPSAVRSVESQRSVVQADRIFALSFGVTVVSWLLVHRPAFFTSTEFRFWAPVGFATYWQLYADQVSLAKKNGVAARQERGVVLASTLWSTLEPLEDLLPRVGGRRVWLASGSADRLSGPLTIEHLAALMRRTSNSVVDTLTIEGAPHEVTPLGLDAEIREAVLAAYLSWIFD